MNREETKQLFDEQASEYDQKWVNMAAINDGIYFFLPSIFASLRPNARVLCVGAGTGKELLFLAKQFPSIHFSVVEPSGAMLEICRHRVERGGFTSRCTFHEGFLESFSDDNVHDAATCFLVSHFILDPIARSELFRQIACRMAPGGVLVSADLASDMRSPITDNLLRIWATTMSDSEAGEAAVKKLKHAYSNDVAVLSPDSVISIITNGGFESVTQFYQAGVVHAFFATTPSIVSN
ncbi:Ubiquinone/menaquinone biosynthesis C-methyltransferase UbiE [BD1-7 clade bacterium]|uniref:Ubiquinone/menaquinone biosynthesis C-methyltransferase UbiE n=1 Tax=BD1-7 clade bacterium TaxID=2029982 RepID=A0A5S9PYV5_9GAMM|nr:Ubiquinone/menaquinone biosynthesis C-methyltransferase UbiE [BD1-7 clade bacterium]CAA0109679.1 Ubiquinone/menaquinone biosynthesis C-methyltransferase UbiE [BD1-7 clade bacterium]CAA0113200.1 Ubiquinone/menaquinone biosynthesis C-methyltransferase UbiE [BD1-7 clade bacterium]